MTSARRRIVMCEKNEPRKAMEVKAEGKIAILDRPLSELIKSGEHLPGVDIDAYVNRSAEDRMKEVETGRVPRRVKRPLNSFMLYRKAYQGRVKEWYLQNNHRIVSQVCGTSWSLEPEHIKQQYDAWARLERIYHRNAHPGYEVFPIESGASKSPLHPVLKYKIDSTMMRQYQQALSDDSINNPGLDSTHSDESYNGGHNWEAPIVTHDQDPMLFIDPAWSNGSSQTQDTRAHMLRGHKVGPHFEDIKDDIQFDNWMNEA